MSDASAECTLTKNRSAKDRLWLLFWASAVQFLMILAGALYLAAILTVRGAQPAE